MAYITSLFSLLLIAGLITWSYTYRATEISWTEQVIRFTNSAINDCFEAQAREKVEEAYSKRSSPINTSPKDDSSKESKNKEIDPAEERRELVRDKIKETRGPKHTSRFLHLSILMGSNASTDDTMAKGALFLLKRLCHVLFQTQDFYDAMSTQGGFEGIDVDSFFKSTFETAKKGLDNTKSSANRVRPIKTAKDLANIVFQSPVEQYLLYKVLRGGGAAEVEAAGSYKSLLQYITLDKKPYLLNLYLAPRELLMALFNDEQVVSKVCEYRMELYHKLKKETGVKNDLQQQFQNEFTTFIPTEVPQAAINFHISLTKPSN